MKKTLAEYRHEKNKAWEKLQNFERKAREESRSLTDTEQQEFNDTLKEYNAAKLAIENKEGFLQEVKEREQREGGIGPIDPISGRPRPSDNLGGKERREKEGRMALAGIARGLVQGERALGNIPQGEFREVLTRSISSSSGSAVIQDPLVLGRVIFALQANNDLVRAGARFVSMSNNSVYPKITAYPSLQWQASEGTAITEDSSLAIGSLKWNFKDAAILVLINDQVLYDSAIDLEATVSQAIIRGINDGILSQIFAGDGTSGTITGLDNITGIQTVAGGSAVLSNYSHIISGIKSLMDVNVNPSNVSAFAPPVVWSQMAGLSATDNQPLMKPDGVKNMPLYWTTAIGEDYGTGNNETRIYMGDFSQMVIGFQGPISFKLVERYKEKLQTGILMHMRLDVQLLHPDNFLRIEDISVS